jgi:hypothetical protein
MRPIDEPIPDDEKLYRELKPNDVNGAEILVTAIEFPASSVHRSKYINPDEIEPRPPRTGLASIRPMDLPVHIDCSGVRWDFFAADAPAEGNAHAEIRSGRTDRPDGDRPDGHRPSGAATRNALRVHLVSKMTIYKHPGDGG